MLAQAKIAFWTLTGNADKIMNMLDAEEANVRNSARRALDTLATTSDLQYRVGLESLRKHDFAAQEWGIRMLSRSSKMKNDRKLLHQAGVVGQKSDYLGTQIWATGVLMKSDLAEANEAIKSTLDAWACKMGNAERLNRYPEYNLFSHALYGFDDPRGDHVYVNEWNWVKRSRSDSGQLWVKFQDAKKRFRTHKEFSQRIISASYGGAEVDESVEESLTFDDNVEHAISLATQMANLCDYRGLNELISILQRDVVHGVYRVRTQTYDHFPWEEYSETPEYKKLSDAIGWIEAEVRRSAISEYRIPKDL